MSNNPNPTPPAPKEPEKFKPSGGVNLTPEMIDQLSEMTRTKQAAIKADALKYPELAAFLFPKESE